MRSYLGKYAKQRAEEFRRTSTPDEWRAYERGMDDALTNYRETAFCAMLRDIWDEHCESYCTACLDSDYPRNAVINDVERVTRAAAFGAIRRAATLAREHDARCAELRVKSPRSAFVLSHMNEASAIRRAIRAAIKSPKA